MFLLQENNCAANEHFCSSSGDICQDNSATCDDNPELLDYHGDYDEYGWSENNCLAVGYGYCGFTQQCQNTTCTDLCGGIDEWYVWITTISGHKCNIHDCFDF